MTQVEIRHAHLFCGLGGGAAGFNAGAAKVGQLSARMRCLGGITFALGATPIWVRPIAIALSTDIPNHGGETQCPNRL